MRENRILTELPMKNGVGVNKNRKVVDWKSTVGMSIELLYRGNRYTVKIIKYNKGRLWVDCNGYIKQEGIKTINFFECKFGGILKIKTKEFKINIGQRFNDDKRDMIIVDRKYKNRQTQNGSTIEEKYYKYSCNKCGYDGGWIVESNLLKGVGCSCCCLFAKTVVPEINSIYAKEYWMVGLGVSEEDAKKYSKCSTQKVVVTCPNCGRKRNVKISDIYVRKSIGCLCSDKISYPEKFMVNMLNQIGVEFQVQYSSDWSEKKKYDFYIPSLNCIIEVHGEQHYKYTGRGRTLQEEQENDKIKEQLAKENCIEHYIVIDCRKSNIDWIKSKILDSKLNDLFDLSKIDWLKCEEFALSNLAKRICDYWNDKEDWETTVTIAENNEWGIKGVSTIVKYLKKGTKLGWTNYNSEEEYKKAVRRKGKNGKKVEVFYDNNSIGVFESVAELERQSKMLFGVKLSQGCISFVCIGKQKHHKGFTFRYIEEENNQQIAS